MNVRFRHSVMALSVVMITLSACEQYQVDRVEESATEAVSAENTEGSVPVVDPKFGIDPRPVRIGFDGPEMDACGGYGEIKELNPDGDNFLTVRAAPTTDADELDRLTSGTGISICETADGWIGIVYEGSGAAGTGCGVGSPVPRMREYDGVCRSGWVNQRFVELIAG